MRMATAVTCLVVMAAGVGEQEPIPISEQLAAAQAEREMWARWTPMISWGCAVMGVFGLAAEISDNGNSRALGMGTLAGLTMTGIGVVAQINLRRLSRKIETLQATQVVPLEGGAYVGYQVGW